MVVEGCESAKLKFFEFFGVNLHLVHGKLQEAKPYGFSLLDEGRQFSARTEPIHLA
jgi:hypothetical protein